MNRPTDPNTLVAALSRDQVRLELGTFDLCCLAGLYLRADRDALASFAEDTVVDLFEQVCDMVEPGADNPRKRATRHPAAPRPAGWDRTLARVDEALIRESLTLLTRTLLGQLADVKGAAARADSPEAACAVASPSSAASASRDSRCPVPRHVHRG